MTKIHRPACILFLAILFFASCQKSATSGTPDPIAGTWNWTDTYAGGNPSYPGWHTTPESTGKTETIILDQKGQWHHLSNGVADGSGNFTIGHGRYNPDPKIVYEYDSIVYFKNGLKTETDAYLISHDTLIYSPALQGLIGAGVKWWVKQKP